MLLVVREAVETMVELLDSTYVPVAVVREIHGFVEEFCSGLAICLVFPWRKLVFAVRRLFLILVKTPLLVDSR